MGELFKAILIMAAIWGWWGWRQWKHNRRFCTGCGERLQLDEVKEPGAARLTKTWVIPLWRGPRKVTETWRCPECGFEETVRFWTTG